MEEKQRVVAFKDSGEKYAEPEVYTCCTEEADAIQELLGTVCGEGDGPIDSLTDKEFAFTAEPITLAELRERFADELEAAEVEGDDDEEDESEGAGA